MGRDFLRNDSKTKKRGSEEIERRKAVLLIQHAPHEHPAALKRALETQGIQSLWIHPFRGDSYPNPSTLRGVISLGGPMGANDDLLHPWIPDECKLLREAALEGLPTVGICLGGQMLARALGGSVEKNSIAEVGWFPMELNSHGREDPIIGAAGSRPLVYHWHHDTFFLPQGAAPLASSEACPRQAFRIGDKAYGFQFHPEADHQLIHEWLNIEGVPEEIRQTQDQHGRTSVQDANTQKEMAREGERASLKITAAISQLFKNHPYSPIDLHLNEQIETWTTEKTPILIEVEGSDRKPLLLKGHISSILTVPDGEFVIFRDENTLLWPIRMDHIQRATPFT